MAVLITLQLHDTFCLFSHPWLLSLLGFPLTFQIQDKPKKSPKIEFHLGPPRFEPTPMHIPNQYQTITPYHISC